MKRRWLFVVALSLVAGACTTSSSVADDVDVASAVEPFAAEFTISSPDGQLWADLGIDELGRARYRVTRSDDTTNRVVLNDSTLGLETSLGSLSMASRLVPLGEASSVTDEFSLPHGKRRTSAVDATLQSFALPGLSDASGRPELRLDVWVSNDAVAYRYVVEAAEPFIIEWERSSFAVPRDHRAWLQRHDAPTVFTPAYEALRSRETTAAAPGRAPNGWTFPALFVSNAGYTLITESALADGAAGSHFSPAATNGEFLLAFGDHAEGNGVGDRRPASQANTWTSPWRIIMSSSDLAGIVESDAVRHLSPPTPDSFDTSWITPGRVSWSWWSDHSSSRDADAMEPFIDLAAAMGWEYSLVDANWNVIDEQRIDELVDYATTRGVKLFFWYNSGGPNNGVTEAPRDLMTDPVVRQAEFARLADLGVAGVKVDFFHSDKPATIQQYRDILADAAQAQLLVNFHGSTLPRGWSREFPNLMTMESVRGAEWYTFNFNYQRVAPRQNTVLPFTRNVVGPMDYTPVVLGDHVNRVTTNGHELGLAVVFESPLLHLVDTPEAYLNQPDEVIDLLASVPTVWDQTVLIDGAPESHVVIARRHNDAWWIGAISALDEPMAVTVDLELLGIEPGRSLTQVCDNLTWDGDTHLDPAQYDITTGLSQARTQLELAANGGCLLRIN